MRKFFVVILVSSLLVLVVAAGYGAYYYQTHKEEIILTLERTFKQLALPYHLMRLTEQEPDAQLLIPIQGLPKSAIANNWGDPRSGGRSHEGIDIFARRGTPVFSATEGYVRRVGFGELGGNFVYITGKGGIRYYYAHLDSIAQGIEIGTRVTSDTVLGFVGNTGNAEGTEPHLHFGMYHRGAKNPYDLLTER